MPTAGERQLRRAAADLIKAAERAVADATPVALFSLRSAAAHAAHVLNVTGTVVRLVEFPGERRGPIGEHTLHDCGGTIWEIQKGDRWVLWCDRCGYLPVRWKVKGHVPSGCCGR